MHAICFAGLLWMVLVASLCFCPFSRCFNCHYNLVLSPQRIFLLRFDGGFSYLCSPTIFISFIYLEWHFATFSLEKSVQIMQDNQTKNVELALLLLHVTIAIKFILFGGPTWELPWWGEQYLFSKKFTCVPWQDPFCVFLVFPRIGSRCVVRARGLHDFFPCKFRGVSQSEGDMID